MELFSHSCNGNFLPIDKDVLIGVKKLAFSSSLVLSRVFVWELLLPPNLLKPSTQ